VVHSQHGIARYLGLVTLDLGEARWSSCTSNTRAATSSTFPSRSSRHQPLHRRRARSAPLHRLGSGQWEKAKRKAARQVRDTAAELLDLYAKRLAREGYAFPLKMQEYETFAATFPFEETPDQAEAIQSVIVDMTLGRPMDRLVCGDVGFGKTEVAMRAAFIAVAAGKQVAILVPDDAARRAALRNFSDRFSSFPVKIAELSRFRSPKEVASRSRARRRPHRHRDRHAQADPEGREVQEPRASSSSTRSTASACARRRS
jgi:transcription-repair coupling factor (superfamily II helicase)